MMFIIFQEIMPRCIVHTYLEESRPQNQQPNCHVQSEEGREDQVTNRNDLLLWRCDLYKVGKSLFLFKMTMNWRSLGHTCNIILIIYGYFYI